MVARTLVLFLLATSCLAADTVTLKIQVVDTAVTETYSTRDVSGYAGYSTTSCGTTAGYGSPNCATVGGAAGAGRTVEKSTTQANVHALLPDGSHVTLWCQASLRRCVPLSPGEYKAEVKGNTAWVHVPKLDGTDNKIKYRAVGGW